MRSVRSGGPTQTRDPDTAWFKKCSSVMLVLVNIAFSIFAWRRISTYKTEYIAAILPVVMTTNSLILLCLCKVSALRKYFPKPQFERLFQPRVIRAQSFSIALMLGGVILKTYMRMQLGISVGELGMSLVIPVVVFLAYWMLNYRLGYMEAISVGLSLIAFVFASLHMDATMLFFAILLSVLSAFKVVEIKKTFEECDMRTGYHVISFHVIVAIVTWMAVIYWGVTKGKWPVKVAIYPGTPLPTISVFIISIYILVWILLKARLYDVLSPVSYTVSNQLKSLALATYDVSYIWLLLPWAGEGSPERFGRWEIVALVFKGLSTLVFVLAKSEVLNDSHVLGPWCRRPPIKNGDNDIIHHPRYS